MCANVKYQRHGYKLATNKFLMWSKFLFQSGGAESMCEGNNNCNVVTLNGFLQIDFTSLPYSQRVGRVHTYN